MGLMGWNGAGMDPIARRFMWDIISRITNTDRECSVILTTHSMEEAEALCNNIGIMVSLTPDHVLSTPHEFCMWFSI